MPSLEIPGSQKRPLGAVLRLSADERTALLDSFEGIGPNLVAAGRTALGESVGLDATDATDVLYMLLGLYQAHRRNILGPSLLVETLQADDDLSSLVSDPEELTAFFERLFTLQSSLGTLSKAYRLAREHAHTFCAADIVSDLRPVFDDVESQPVAAAIVHTLRLSYHRGARYELEELFVGLDERDLQSLSSAIDRALKKHQSLSGYVNERRLPLLVTEDE